MWVLFHLGPIKNEKGEVMLFLVTLKDITEFKDPIVGTGKHTETYLDHSHSKMNRKDTRFSVISNLADQGKYFITQRSL